MLRAKCNYDNPADALFCMKCGTKVENRCSSCNTVNPADANFCRKCGGALGAGVPVSSPSPHAALETPRVEVTQRFNRISGAYLAWSCVGYALYTTHERPFFFNQSICTGEIFFHFEANS